MSDSVSVNDLSSHQLQPDISIIIPASNEESYIDRCLDAVVCQDFAMTRVQVVVATNGCHDATAERAMARQDEFTARGWSFLVLSIEQAGKVNALNEAEKCTRADITVYLDADVICAPDLLRQLYEALSRDVPMYATGTLQVTPAKTWVTRQYAKIWVETPFVTSGAVGAGLFAVNRLGRGRWKDFPDIISDDTFVRLHFSPEERVEVSARYYWPMVEGLERLIKVRRRQDAGVREIALLWPNLLKNEQKGSLGFSRLSDLALRFPAALALYCFVHAATRLVDNRQQWSRGR